MHNRKTRGVVVSDKPEDLKITSLEDLAMAIKYKRTSSGLSIHKTSSLCGISDKTLQSIENGDDSKFSSVLKISKMLGIKFNISGI
ncbi:MAG: helix-turn-helix transcriptional regulator [Campylobacterota bacterium]|nr:helix-turn-helix transcriptional regulator [Campylobacterota bacterium]